MKRFIALAIILFALPVYAADVNVSWTHDGVNTAGYTLYFWQTVSPATVWNKSVTGSTVRSMKLDENYFAPGVEYSFQMTAFNAVAESLRSATATWTRAGQIYTPPGDVLPATMYMRPSGINTLIIQLP